MTHERLQALHAALFPTAACVEASTAVDHTLVKARFWMDPQRQGARRASAQGDEPAVGCRGGRSRLADAPAADHQLIVAAAVGLIAPRPVCRAHLCWAFLAPDAVRIAQQINPEQKLSRRRKTSLAEDLIELVALAPWWVGVALAAGSYLLLHPIAEQPVKAAVQAGQAGAVVTQVLWRTLASFGQYVLPLIFLAGSGVSAWRRWERRQLVAEVDQSQAADVLDGMSWQQFEKLVGEGFRLQGFQVTETGGGGADGGVDLVLTNGTEKFFVQCKQWRAFKVGVNVVRELYGVMAARGATGGFVVTSGRFTDDAAAFAEGRNIQLMDGAQLHALIRRAQAGEDRSPAPERSQMMRAPSCPVCAKLMVQRTAKRGSNVGRSFWGCSAYPACRGTRSVARGIER